MRTLKNWSARRSGGRITVTGIDDTGTPQKIANVDTIVVEGWRSPAVKVIATDKDGEKYWLLVA